MCKGTWSWLSGLRFCSWLNVFFLFSLIISTVNEYHCSFLMIIEEHSQNSSGWIIYKRFCCSIPTYISILLSQYNVNQMHVSELIIQHWITTWCVALWGIHTPIQLQVSIYCISWCGVYLTWASPTPLPTLAQNMSVIVFMLFISVSMMYCHSCAQ